MTNFKSQSKFWTTELWISVGAICGHDHMQGFRLASVIGHGLIIWHCCQNDRLFQNKWPKIPTHATYASDTWSSILQFVHNLFWLKLKWNARSKLFYCIIYRSSMIWWSSRTLTKLKSQSQKRFNERKYQYLK